MNKEGKSASEVLQGVVDGSKADFISFYDIKIALHERGFGLLMLFFSLPVCIPILVPPGLSLIPSIPLLFFSVQMVMGIDSPWLPKWLGEKSVKRRTLALMVEKASPHLKKVEKFLRPRFSFASSRQGERVVGVFCVIFALSIANPLPFSNLVPAIGIVFMSLGLLSKDGISIIAGMLIGSLGVAFSFLVIIFGAEAILNLFGFK